MSAPAPLLILGGTGEARELAAALDRSGVVVISSLAGRVREPRLPAGRVRVGPFGGSEGLARYLERERIAALIDATHPFAARISAHARAAAASTNTPLARLEREPWQMQPGDRWQFVESLADAAAAVREQGGRVFLTTGRGGLEHFSDIREAWFLIRCVEHPAVALPPRSLLLLDRGPFTIDRERALIEGHRITLLVAKHSGGAATAAKLAAARERGLGVLLVRRPPPPAGVPLLRTVASARSWALGVLGAP